MSITLIAHRLDRLVLDETYVCPLLLPSCHLRYVDCCCGSVAVRLEFRIRRLRRFGATGISVKERSDVGIRKVDKGHLNPADYIVLRDDGRRDQKDTFICVVLHGVSQRCVTS